MPDNRHRFANPEHFDMLTAHYSEGRVPPQRQMSQTEDLVPRGPSPAPSFKGSVSYNDKVRRGFVDIDETYQPYAKEQAGAADFLYSEDKNARLPAFVSPSPQKLDSPTIYGSKHDIWGGSPNWRKNSIFWEPPSADSPLARPPPKPAIDAGSAKVSKNSIFDAPHTILKPATKMTSEELDALKRGETTPTSAGPLEDTPPGRFADGHSMAVPVSLPAPPVHSLKSPPPVDNAFLSSFNSPNRRGWVDLDDPAPSPRRSSVDSPFSAETPPVTSPPPRRPDNEGQPVWTYPPSTSDNVQLFYLPTKKNFLGEGRYSQVFLGHYMHVDQSSEHGSGTPTAMAKKRSEDLHVCAVKRLHPNKEAQAIGLAEVHILRRLSPLHRNIIHFLGVKDEADVDSPQVRAKIKAASADVREVDAIPRLLIVLEYAQKGCMWDWVMRHKKGVSRKLWMKWARQLASAVECMHGQGIVHHDIKPHNILLSEFLDVLLADFGNACYVPELEDPQMSTPLHEYFPVQAPPSPTPSVKSSEPSSTRLTVTIPSSSNLKPGPITPGSPTTPTSQILTDAVGRGTQAYSAPETFHPTNPYSFPIDIYSLGVTLYAVMTTSEPFSLAKSAVMMLVGAKKGFFESGLQGSGDVGAGGRMRFPDGEVVGEDLMDVVRRCVARDPEMRPTATELVKLLESLDGW
ncbi:hypothetical protein HK104_011361 [Borealophlyctis nickersoniae]|nr:hypothetical protein HK104_011361 [Borealophlyctis nickersoniae]